MGSAPFGNVFSHDNFPPTQDPANKETGMAELYPERLQDDVNEYYSHDKVLPRQMFAMKIQGYGNGRIISSRTVQAFMKDVTQHMYGGDITRKMKLREKQKKGKAKMQSMASVHIPQDVFVKMIRADMD